LQVDAGEVICQNGIKISSLSQDLPRAPQTAIDYVVAGDESYMHWQAEFEKAQMAQDIDALAIAQEHLEHMGAYAKPAIAASILSGLGFKPQEFEQHVQSFSGGWQMRLKLARCLLTPADLYLLDEPTNHLDLEAIVWLEKWIKNLSATVILISHDREFLDQTVDKILHIDQQNFKLYTGNYSAFENMRAEQLRLQQHLYQEQQAHLAHLMDFVRRFKAKASKAKQAQSRLKAIERIDIIAAAQLDSAFNFEFLSTPVVGDLLLKCQNLSIGYPNKPMVTGLEFEIHAQDRIGLLGLNGQGKSTFVKTLVSLLNPLSGEFWIHPKLKVGYYAQDQLEALDLNLSPLANMQTLDPKAKEQDLRNFLGSFRFSDEMALAPIRYFSGGEKARLALAKLIWQAPGLLILDEPTNHLDIEMRTAIEIALQTYSGAVILISHDRHLLKTSVNDFYLIHAGQFQAFTGDLGDYQQWLQNLAPELKPKAQASQSKQDYRDLKSLQTKMHRLESDMAALNAQLTTINNQLADEHLYQAAEKFTLAKYLGDKQRLEEKLQTLENAYLENMQRLEDANTKA
jgi:ATP-binding cassette subfamily F protein 3